MRTLECENKTAYQRGFEEAKELAAQVIDNEIILREMFELHMEPLDNLAVAIRALEKR